MTQHDLGRAAHGGDEADRLKRSAEAQAGQVRREAGSVADEARGVAHDVVAEARKTGQAIRGEAAGLVGNVRHQLVSHAQAQKDSLADRLAAVAEQVHGTADGMRDREAWLADLVDRGARELDGLADELRQRDIRSLVGGVETLAQRHPAVFIGTAVAMGFALSRMVRGAAASSPRGYAGVYTGGEPTRARVYGRAGRYGEEPGAYTDSSGRAFGGLTTSGQMPGGQAPDTDPLVPGAVRRSDI